MAPQPKSKGATWDRYDWLAILVIAGIWIAMAITVHPGGDFPLNDDWAYARSVQTLLDHRGIELRSWTPAITLSHTVWGTLASGVLGFSFESLRLSMLLLGLVGLVAVYGLLRELGGDAVRATVGALTIGVNPIYFALAGTFMTDVSFFTFFTVGLWGFARTLRRPTTAASLTGATAALLATLNRQIGISVALAFAIGVGAAPERRRRWLKALVPALIAAAALIAWELLLVRGHTSLVSNVKVDELKTFLSGSVSEVGERIWWNVLGVLLALGLFSLPLTLVTETTEQEGAAAGIRPKLFWSVTVLATLWLAWMDRLLPMVGNILLPTGIGPTTLRDVHILKLEHLPTAPLLVRGLVTAAAVAGTLLLLRRARTAVQGALAARSDDDPARPITLLILAAAAMYGAPLLVAPYFDRYLLPLLPACLGILILAAKQPHLSGRARPRGAATMAALLLALGALVSVAGMHDYLSWNRARWAAIEWLEEDHDAVPEEIDGGFEYGGWRHYHEERRLVLELSWWWVRDDRWVLAFAPFDGRRVVHREPWDRWLPPFGQGEVVVLEREPVDPATPEEGPSRQPAPP